MRLYHLFRNSFVSITLILSIVTSAFATDYRGFTDAEIQQMESAIDYIRAYEQSHPFTDGSKSRAAALELATIFNLPEFFDFDEEGALAAALGESVIIITQSIDGVHPAVLASMLIHEATHCVYDDGGDHVVYFPHDEDQESRAMDEYLAYDTQLSFLRWVYGHLMFKELVNIFDPVYLEIGDWVWICVFNRAYFAKMAEALEYGAKYHAAFEKYYGGPRPLTMEEQIGLLFGRIPDHPSFRRWRK